MHVLLSSVRLLRSHAHYYLPPLSNLHLSLLSQLLNASMDQASISFFHSDSFVGRASQLKSLVDYFVNESLTTLNEQLLNYPIVFPGWLVPFVPHPTVSTKTLAHSTTSFLEAKWQCECRPQGGWPVGRGENTYWQRCAGFDCPGSAAEEKLMVQEVRKVELEEGLRSPSHRRRLSAVTLEAPLALGTDDECTVVFTELGCSGAVAQKRAAALECARCLFQHELEWRARCSLAAGDAFCGMTAAVASNSSGGSGGGSSGQAWRARAIQAKRSTAAAAAAATAAAAKTAPTPALSRREMVEANATNAPSSAPTFAPTVQSMSLSLFGSPDCSVAKLGSWVAQVGTVWTSQGQCAQTSPETRSTLGAFYELSTRRTSLGALTFALSWGCVPDVTLSESCSSASERSCARCEGSATLESSVCTPFRDGVYALASHGDQCAGGSVPVPKHSLFIAQPAPQLAVESVEVSRCTPPRNCLYDHTVEMSAGACEASCAADRACAATTYRNATLMCERFSCAVPIDYGNVTAYIVASPRGISKCGEWNETDAVVTPINAWLNLGTALAPMKKGAPTSCRRCGGDPTRNYCSIELDTHNPNPLKTLVHVGLACEAGCVNCTVSRDLAVSGGAPTCAQLNGGIALLSGAPAQLSPCAPPPAPPALTPAQEDAILGSVIVLGVIATVLLVAAIVGAAIFVTIRRRRVVRGSLGDPNTSGSLRASLLSADRMQGGGEDAGVESACDPAGTPRASEDWAIFQSCVRAAPSACKRCMRLPLALLCGVRCKTRCCGSRTESKHRHRRLGDYTNDALGFALIALAAVVTTATGFIWYFDSPLTRQVDRLETSQTEQASFNDERLQAILHRSNTFGMSVFFLCAAALLALGALRSLRLEISVTTHATEATAAAAAMDNDVEENALRATASAQEKRVKMGNLTFGEMISVYGAKGWQAALALLAKILSRKAAVAALALLGVDVAAVVALLAACMWDNFWKAVTPVSNGGIWDAFGSGIDSLLIIQILLAWMQPFFFAVHVVTFTVLGVALLRIGLWRRYIPQSLRVVRASRASGVRNPLRRGRHESSGSTIVPTNGGGVGGKSGDGDGGESASLDLGFGFSRVSALSAGRTWSKSFFATHTTATSIDARRVDVVLTTMARRAMPYLLSNHMVSMFLSLAFCAMLFRAGFVKVIFFNVVAVSNLFTTLLLLCTVLFTTLHRCSCCACLCSNRDWRCSCCIFARPWHSLSSMVVTVVVVGATIFTQLGVMLFLLFLINQGGSGTGWLFSISATILFVLLAAIGASSFFDRLEGALILDENDEISAKFYSSIRVEGDDGYNDDAANDCDGVVEEGGGAAGEELIVGGEGERDEGDEEGESSEYLTGARRWWKRVVSFTTIPKLLAQRQPQHTNTRLRVSQMVGVVGGESDEIAIVNVGREAATHNPPAVPRVAIPLLVFYRCVFEAKEGKDRLRHGARIKWRRACLLLGATCLVATAIMNIPLLSLDSTEVAWVDLIRLFQTYAGSDFMVTPSNTSVLAPIVEQYGKVSFCSALPHSTHSHTHMQRTTRVAGTA